MSHDQQLGGLLGDYSIANMKSIFSHLDRDKNGFLTIDDWRDVFKLMDTQVTDEEIAEIMKICDSDNSGSTNINISQFMSSLVDTTGGDSKHAMVSSLIMPRKAQNDENYGVQLKPYHKGVSIKKLIQDNDRRSGLYETRFIMDGIMTKYNITTKEIDKAYQKCLKQEQKLKRLGIPPDHLPVDKFFKSLKISKDSNSFLQLKKHLDSHNTGFIDFRQSLFRFYLLSNATTKQKVDFSFKICDNDQSGLIDFPELLQILLLTHPLIMTDQDAIRLFKKADFLLAQFDVDSNGELDKDEYLKMAQKFPQLLFP